MMTKILAKLLSFLLFERYNLITKSMNKLFQQYISINTYQKS